MSEEQAVSMLNGAFTVALSDKQKVKHVDGINVCFQVTDSKFNNIARSPTGLCEMVQL